MYWFIQHKEPDHVSDVRDFGGKRGASGVEIEKCRQSFLKTGKTMYFSLVNGEKLVYDITDIK